MYDTRSAALREPHPLRTSIVGVFVGRYRLFEEARELWMVLAMVEGRWVEWKAEKRWKVAMGPDF